MQIEEERKDQTSCLRVRGRLDSNTSPEFLAFVQTQIGDGLIRLVVDLSEVVYVSSAGLRAFFTVYKKLPQEGLILSRVRPAVFEVFAIAGFDQIFTFRSDADAAYGEPS